MADRTPEETRAYAQATVTAFYESITPEEAREVEASLKQVVSRNARATAKIRQIQVIADKAYRHAAGRVACARGCPHCCHLHVPITAAEARAIGEQIGVQPRDATRLPPRDPMSFSMQTPCTFLKEDACSIYEHRPVQCRTSFNFDQDNYWCRYENWDKPGAVVPKPVIEPLAIAYALVSQDKSGDVALADIRDFFPDGKP